ncbi:MAG: hypothetical protein IKH67_07285 [Lachnospiraceae bacterium]|nr:hypothetical protein [Lachnospiraceae bacterium]
MQCHSMDTSFSARWCQIGWRRRSKGTYIPEYLP